MVFLPFSRIVYIPFASVFPRDTSREPEKGDEPMLEQAVVEPVAKNIR